MATAFSSTTVLAGSSATAVQYNSARYDILANAGDFAVATGGGNNYALSVDAQISAYSRGQVFKFQAPFTNTSTATLAVNGLAAKNIVKNSGATLDAGDISTNEVVVVVFDNTNMAVVSQLATTANKSALIGGPVSDASSLHTHANLLQKIASTTTAVTISNTTETSLVAVTVPANTLGTNNAVIAKLFFSTFGMANNSTFTFRLKYGGSTVCSPTFSVPNSGAIAGMKGEAEFKIQAAGAVGSQQGTGHVFLNTGGTATVYSLSGASFAVDDQTGTAAETSTNDLPLYVSGQYSGAGGASSMTMYNYIIYRVS